MTMVLVPYAIHVYPQPSSRLFAWLATLICSPPPPPPPPPPASIIKLVDVENAQSLDAPTTLQIDPGVVARRLRSLSELFKKVWSINWLDMVSFLELPGEIRQSIYAYVLHPNEYLSAYVQVENLITAHTDRSRGPSCDTLCLSIKRSTPSILLLNKWVTWEALDVLHRIPLSLQGPPGPYLAIPQMEITDFISKTLLQNIHFGILRLDAAHKQFVLSVLNAWAQKNELRRLDVYRPRTALFPRNHWKVVKDQVSVLSARAT
ncbi:hypothetical protein POX_e06786 [Penicillium oxalicum]|uniref:hypothetical protein n=1 Tax=Penicillium oxalicum TaxID=69781 RepID=UPI0020B89EDD|nr:hypothetical protein POX_e06786 [Penicillium oxalicum]KAI2788765.1 hypothetical protein POX_e06786 [Penicillium oxalicum]